MKPGEIFLYQTSEQNYTIVLKSTEGFVIRCCSCGAERIALCRCKDGVSVGTSLEEWNHAAKHFASLFGKTLLESPIKKITCCDPFAQMAKVIGDLFAMETYPVVENTPGKVSFKFSSK